VFHGVTGIQNVAFSPPRKNDFGVFFSSLQEQGFLCCKNGVVLHKTYLAICPMQISLSMKDENESLKKEHFMSRKLRLTAWMQNY